MFTHSKERAGATRPRGIRLIEVMIAVVTFSIIAVIVTLNLLTSRLQANESAAISTLKNIYWSQSAALLAGVVTVRIDGGRGYSYFQELSGARNVRTGVPPYVTEGTSKVTSPLLLPAGFGNVDTNGLVSRAGYLFHMYLPGTDASWLAEAPKDAPYPQVDPKYSDIEWACYAWPVSYGSSGQRAFFINNNGDVLEAQNTETKYSGTKNVPDPTAVLKPGGKSMSDPLAGNEKATDGNVWTFASK